MPRPARTKDLTPPVVAEEVVSADAAAAEALGRQLKVIDADFGDEVIPYNRERVITEARFFMATAAQSLIELGRRLILLKEHEPHGQFLESLAAIGIDDRLARRAMQATLKLGRGEIRKQVEHLGRSKLLELLVLDEEQIDLLASGGTVADITLDEVDRMTVSELRTHLRKSRHDQTEAEQAHEQQLVEKNKKIDELDRALSRRDKLPPEDRVHEVVGGIWATVEDFELTHQSLRQAFTVARDAYAADDQAQPGAVYTAQCNALVWLMQRLEDIRQEFHLFDVSPQKRVIAPFEDQSGA